jgi:hypothetical protein
MSASQFSAYANMGAGFPMPFINKDCRNDVHLRTLLMPRDSPMSDNVNPSATPMLGIQHIQPTTTKHENGDSDYPIHYQSSSSSSGIDAWRMLPRDGDISGSSASASACPTKSEAGNTVPEYMKSPVNSGSDLSSSRPSSKGSAYKFKNNITMRFSSEEGMGNCGSDSSSSNSNELKLKAANPLKRKHVQYRCPPSSPSTSEFSSNGDSGTFSSTMLITPKPLPGFVLHPTGSHYMPMSMNPSDLDGILSKDCAANNACHPITISVDFGAPRISAQNICLLDRDYIPQEPAMYLGADSSDSPDDRRSPPYKHARHAQECDVTAFRKHIYQ